MPVYHMMPWYQLSLCWVPFCRMSRRLENVTADLPRFPRNSFTGFLNPFQSRSSSFFPLRFLPAATRPFADWTLSKLVFSFLSRSRWVSDPSASDETCRRKPFFDTKKWFLFEKFYFPEQSWTTKREIKGEKSQSWH
jgi:hypothetical protein